MSFCTNAFAAFALSFSIYIFSDTLLAPLNFSYAIRMRKQLLSARNSSVSPVFIDLLSQASRPAQKVRFVPSTCAGVFDGKPGITLPTAMFGRYCSGKTRIDLDKNYVAHCAPLDSIDEKSCTTKEILSDQYFTKEALENIELVGIEEGSLKSPQWLENRCHNVVEEAEYALSFGNRQSASVRLKYTTLEPRNVTEFVQKCFVFVEPNEKEVIDVISTRTPEGENGTFVIPSGESCGQTGSTMDVVLGTSTASACSIPANSCIEVLSAISDLLNVYRPSAIFYGDAEIPVIQRTVNSTAMSGCIIPSEVNIHIGMVDINGNCTVNLCVWEVVETVMFQTTKTWWLPFRVSFHTRYPKPLRERHAIFPNIDLKLPSDFFYPFFVDNGIAQNSAGFVLCIGLVVAYIV
ncbi:hypothetical protein L596_004580 [Steinernema carpocapsae]|uniref:Tectonic domain-containing protein n=1 Tax=Steinernema carpocapsae TaxID=34508 RepID=A0A4U8UW78_STECR|nr:hypothetical protein L596_004580 [Steinernema carpocapsae]